MQWELDVPLPAVPPTHIEENYRSLYALDAGDTPGNDLALRLHPNGLCVVALAPSHAALAASHGSGGSGGEQQAAPDHPAAAQQHGVQPPAAEAAPAAGAAAAPAPGGAGGQQGAGAAGGERQQAAARAADSSAAAQLALAPKLLQAEFRKGRGPLLQADTVLGRQALWMDALWGVQAPLLSSGGPRPATWQQGPLCACFMPRLGWQGMPGTPAAPLVASPAACTGLSDGRACRQRSLFPAALITLASPSAPFASRAG